MIGRTLIGLNRKLHHRNICLGLQEYQGHPGAMVIAPIGKSRHKPRFIEQIKGLLRYFRRTGSTVFHFTKLRLKPAKIINHRRMGAVGKRWPARLKMRADDQNRPWRADVLTEAFEKDLSFRIMQNQIGSTVRNKKRGHDRVSIVDDTAS